MTSNILGIRLQRTVRVLGATLTLVGCMWTPATAQSERAEYAIEGTWAVQVTPYNCATGVSFPGFYGGGRSYTLTTVTFVLFGQGVQAWAQRNTMSITLNEPNQFTGETRVDFQLVPGPLPPPAVPLPPNACARTTATRYP
jgi:hypothetical protein